MGDLVCISSFEDPRTARKCGGGEGDGEGRAGLLYEAGLGFGRQAFDSRETTLNHDRCQV